ncbi:MAG: hypothetical protein HXX17_11490 [Geobacteraceae bacterium]|nr:hypothetical protein [Geobacteraceae bacterium]
MNTEQKSEIDSKAKLEEIFNSSNPVAAVQALSATEIYSIIQDIGLENSFELFQFATIEQARVILDLDLWDEWTISLERTTKWLDMILSADDNFALNLLSNIDQELLIILLKKTLTVGGGVADIINSEDLNREWDHTFDEVFFLRFEDEEHSDLIMKLLELLHNENHRVYRSLMLGAESELVTELEETAWQFRVGRLEDEGITVEH